MTERSRISPEQRRLMLDFVKKHPIIAYGRVDSSDGSKLRNKLLSEMASLLNNVESGSTKSAEKWLRSWQDWKSDTKKKANEVARYSGETNIVLTDLEQDLVDFLSTITNLEAPNYVPDTPEKTSVYARAHSPPSAEDYESDTADPIRVKIESDSQMYEPKSKRRRTNSESVEERMVSAMERQASSTLEVARQLGRLADVVALYLKAKTQQAGSEEF